MLEAPTVLRVSEQAAAVIPITIPRSAMGTVMGPALRELKEALLAQGLDPAGPVFAHHLRMDDALFEFELGLPTGRPVRAAGRVRPGSLPAGTVARALYRGPYEGLPSAWGAFRGWIAQSGHRCGPDLWEAYVAGPEASRDPSDWRTELNQPLSE